MLNFGEFMVVLVTILVVLGVGRLPQLGESIGRMRRNYKRAVEGKSDIDITPPRVISPPTSQKASDQEPEDAQLVD
jgi:Sec-independent protein translocase protein TatA